MAKKTTITANYTFYDQLYYFYFEHRKEIINHYNDLTRRIVIFNDTRDHHHKTFLWKPQAEAFEIYIFLKEILNNEQVFKMFDDWRKHQGFFSDRDNGIITTHGQQMLFDDETEHSMDELFKQMKRYREAYPNYIFALAMGLGKTYLMATCIFYEFLLAHKFPNDKRYCHNALIFAPDKTVLQSQSSILNFKPETVMPKEYANFLNQNIKFSYLSDSSSTLNTLDGSDFNIIISNTQKIIVKKKSKEDSPADLLFSDSSLLSELYGEDAFVDDTSLMINQRFERLCRLPQLGVYVDEAHHLFGADLEKQLRAGTAKKTSLRDTINLLNEKTPLVACYNFTGTPYVNNQPLPEVVYAYGLEKAITYGFLKDADPMQYTNVKNADFLKNVIHLFFQRYGGNTYEELKPKLAIYASTIDEAINEVRPAVEQALVDNGLSTDLVLVNVGDFKYTKQQDIFLFNHLDDPQSEGNNKQVIILVGKGTEGWDCRSLFGVAMYRSPKSKVFVLQATMRCLRKITDQQQTATIFLSEDNYAILDAELKKNFNVEINALKNKDKKEKKTYAVRVLPPIRTIRLKQITHQYRNIEKEYKDPVDFGLKDMDLSPYESSVEIKRGLVSDRKLEKYDADEIIEKKRYSELMLVCELSRYLNKSCILLDRILRESVDGLPLILDRVNKYNQIIEDVLVDRIFHTLCEVKYEKHEEEKNVVLLREPKDKPYYEFTADEDLVVSRNSANLKESDKEKSFHADTYCFDSQPEKRLFDQYVTNDDVKEVYFTGMFTAEQGDLYVRYFDPEAKCIRSYYPDFIAKMKDGTYQLIEVKGDNKINDVVVKAKAEAARELASASNIEYVIYRGSDIMDHDVLEESVDNSESSDTPSIVDLFNKS